MQRLGKNNISLVSASERVIIAAFLYLAFFISYGIANRVVPIQSSTDLTTALDIRVPFIAEFVYPFYLAYVILPAPIFLATRHKQVVAISVAFIAMLTIASIAFILFPVYVPRPESLPATCAGNLVARIYEWDRPVCGFPSLHVSISFFAALVSLRMSRPLGWLLLGFAVLTSLSVLFIKQHVILDVAGGIVLSLSAYAGVRRYI